MGTGAQPRPLLRVARRMEHRVGTGPEANSRAGPARPIQSLVRPLRLRCVGGVILLAVFCLGAGCGGQASGSAPLEGRLQDALDGALSEWLVPGASVAVIDHDRHLEVVAGSTDLDAERQVTVDTRFRIASVTKMYMAALALRLVDRGVLSLDEPLGTLAGAVPTHLAFVHDLTLRQLLSHTTGLAQTITRDEDRHSTLTLQDRLDRIPPPVCDPGTCWSYADGNYAIAQLVLETATGRSLADLFDDELIQPLALAGTALLGTDTDDERFPSQYALRTDAAGHRLEPRRLFEQALPRQDTLVTTSRDAAAFAEALFGGVVVEPKLLKDMLNTAVMRDLPCPDTCPFGYGLGVFHYDDIAGHDFVGHDGSSGTIVVHDQDRHLTIAILTNGGEQHMSEFLNLIVRAVDSTST